ncbi:MAG: phosphohydrolase [Caldimicrobium thiodismutans]|uniref:5'-deoxynucleotidase n=1 Tax=Caldimicrobium thiodismutans TaxID=1653476 RepID=A0A2N7PJ55_9BACT|nr:MAG: phosphohydrolase [Caldimicrobium thiodismutans]PMP62607.1 MAG: phosphohydrolase [Caldimicrobium thiodismutans]
MSLRHRLAKLLFEASLLKRIERTGYSYLGTGKENVASHSFGVVFCTFILCKLFQGQVNEERALKMALLHDFPEARIGDFNAVNKLYNQADEFRALKEAFFGLSFEEEVLKLFEEYRQKETLEAKIVHDADTLDLMVQLKEQKDLNNPFAERWLNYAKRRLILEESKRLSEALLETEWCSWWLERLIKEKDEKEP